MIQWNFNNKDNNTFGKYINHFWGSLLYLLISMPLGIIYFTFAVTFEVLMDSACFSSNKQV